MWYQNWSVFLFVYWYRALRKLERKINQFIKKNIRSIEDAIQNYFSEEKIDNVECISCSKEKFVKACFEKIESIEKDDNFEEKKEFLIFISKKAIELYNQTRSAIISHEEMIIQLETMQHTKFKNLMREEQNKLKIIYFKVKTSAILSSKIAKYPVILINLNNNNNLSCRTFFAYIYNELEWDMIQITLNLKKTSLLTKF